MEFIGELLAAPFVCIGWIIVGAIAGAIAHSVMGSNAPLIVDILLGLAGSFVGGILVSILGLARYRADDGLGGVITSIVVATIGAIVLIAIGRAFSGGRRAAR